MGKQNRNQYIKYLEKTSCGPGPAAYNPLRALKKVVDKEKPNFQYYRDDGFHNSVLRQTQGVRS